MWLPGRCRAWVFAPLSIDLQPKAGLQALWATPLKACAWLAAQILAVSDPALNERIAEARAKMREEVEKAGEEISRKYA